MQLQNTGNVGLTDASIISPAADEICAAGVLEPGDQVICSVTAADTATNEDFEARAMLLMVQGQATNRADSVSIVSSQVEHTATLIQLPGMSVSISLPGAQTSVFTEPGGYAKLYAADLQSVSQIGATICETVQSFSQIVAPMHPCTSGIGTGHLMCFCTLAQCLLLWYTAVASVALRSTSVTGLRVSAPPCACILFYVGFGRLSDSRVCLGCCTSDPAGSIEVMIQVKNT